MTTTDDPPSSRTQVIPLTFKCPLDYPYLEPLLNVHLPMHFTHTTVDPIWEPGHVWFEAYQAIQLPLLRLCTTFEPPIVCAPVFGRVRNDKTALQGRAITDVTSPRVLAIYVDVEDMQRWREVEERVSALLTPVFRTWGPPVRYYYGGVTVDFGEWF